MPTKNTFKGKGFGWFRIPNHFIGSASRPGAFFKMSPSPELRLYMVLLTQNGKKASPRFEIENSKLRELANLDRRYLSSARKALVDFGLILTEKTGKETYRYEILGRDGARSTLMGHQRDNYFQPPNESPEQGIVTPFDEPLSWELNRIEL